MKPEFRLLLTLTIIACSVFLFLLLYRFSTVQFLKLPLSTESRFTAIRTLASLIWTPKDFWKPIVKTKVDISGKGNFAEISFKVKYAGPYDVRLFIANDMKKEWIKYKLNLNLVFYQGNHRFLMKDIAMTSMDDYLFDFKSPEDIPLNTPIEGVVIILETNANRIEKGKTGELTITNVFTP